MGESSELRFPDKYVQVGQVSTRFWEAGDQGPTVVLVHGLGGSVEQWSANIEALSEHHHVVALDLMGAGRSDKPAASYSAPNLARFVNDFLETKGVARTSLIQRRGLGVLGKGSDSLMVRAGDRRRDALLGEDADPPHPALAGG